MSAMFTAKYDGHCTECSCDIEAGDEAGFGEDGIVCEDCALCHLDDDWDDWEDGEFPF